MAHREYLIRYSNGFKRHVSLAEFILLGELQQLGPREYLSGSSIAASIEQTNGPSYLPGSFIIERDGQRERERLQTSKGQIQQLEAMGWSPSTEIGCA